MLRGLRRLVDLVALGLFALVFLFPRPGVRVNPALARASTQVLDRVAELQAHLVAQPDDVDAALELSDLYDDQWRPDWALATLGPLLLRHPDDFRIHFGMAVGYADRFDFPSAQAAIEKAQAACDRAAARIPCGEPDHVRMGVFERAVGDVVAQHVNPIQDPNRAKEIIDSALHNFRVEPGHRPFVLPKRPAAPAAKPGAAAAPKR
jgi:hypothetical protein